MFEKDLKQRVAKKVFTTFSNMDFNSDSGLCERFGLMFPSL
jgi:hypothetical protein